MTFPTMIFAAGFGTRMGELTQDTPKPMVELAGRPMIDHAIKLVRDLGVTRIVANTHYLRDVIEPHLSAHDILISPESPDILDTGGGLKAAAPLLGSEVVITINPDALWLDSNPIEMLIDAWKPDMHALMLLVRLSSAVTTRKVGDFSLEKGKIDRKGDFLYTGVQIIRINQLDKITHRAFSLNQYWDLLADDAPLDGIVYDGKWCDVGTPEGLREAEGLLNGV